VETVEVGLFLSSEEYTPAELIEQARRAEQAGFRGLWISDHFHPWLDDQGQSPFVWSLIGALSQACSLPIATAVTCPIMRVHPAIVAQAAATSAVLTGGRFTLGVGTGEALNESIVGEVWPPAPIRLAMLKEAVLLIRKLWNGKPVTHKGEFYTVHHARIYTRPEQPPPIHMSAYGPKAMELALDIADGLISTRPDANGVARFHQAGKPAAASMKACYAASEEEAVKVAHKRWRTEGLPGELTQVLPAPQHVEQATELVTPEMTARAVVCGPDRERHLKRVREYAAAGVDRLYVTPVGPNYGDMIELYQNEIVPALGA
jgi:G6PDH family F420-dependent oxidoreductase